MPTILQSGAPRLRRGSRFTRGANVIVAASSLTNLVSGRALTRAGNGPVGRIATPAGVAQSFRNSGMLVSETLPALGTAPYIEFWLGVPINTGGNASNQGFGDAGMATGSATNQTGLCINVKNGNKSWGAVYNWGDLNVADDVLTLGKLTLLSTHRYADRMELWRDGRLVKTFVQAPKNYPASAFHVGGFVADPFWYGWSDAILCGQIVGAWSAQEIRAFHADPVSAILEPMPAFNWALLAPAGGQDATAPGAVWAMGLGLTPGAPSAGSTAAGATLAASVALMAGTGQASSSAAGATLPVGLALVPGAARADSTAGGAMWPLSLSWAPGSASGSGSATAPGASWPLGLALAAGQGTASSTAAGAQFPASVTWSPGAASGSGAGTAPGATWAVGLGWSPGAASATGSAVAPGAVWALGLALVPGVGRASSTAAGANLPIGVSWVPGAAGAASGVTAPGAVWTLGLSLAAGAPSASSAAPGAALALRLDWMPGQASSQGADFTHYRLYVVAPERRSYRIVPENRAYRIKP